MITSRAYRTVGLALTLTLAGCGEGRGPFAPLPVEWSPVGDAFGPLPEGVQVLQGVNRTLPLRVWAVRIADHGDDVTIGVVVSEDADGRSTPTDLALRSDACVLVNGGFYWIDETDRARHIGLVVDDGVVRSDPVDRVMWQQVRYPTARATVGADSTGSPVVRWVSGGARGLVTRDHPFPNALGRPALPADSADAAPWSPAWALSAGPAIVVDGRPTVTREQEAFFDGHIPRVHPRSAAGVTADGELVLVVVDGRQPRSRGVTLEELAVVLRDLGAEWALNLDGGGSSALVINGQLVNRPSGSDREREIVSALTVTCR